MLAGHLIDGSGLDFRILPVLIVDLQLDELCVGMIRQDLVEKFGPVVK